MEYDKKQLFGIALAPACRSLLLLPNEEEKEEEVLGGSAVTIKSVDDVDLDVDAGGEEVQQE